MQSELSSNLSSKSINFVIFLPRENYFNVVLLVDFCKTKVHVTFLKDNVTKMSKKQNLENMETKNFKIFDIFIFSGFIKNLFIGLLV
jgi:predicted amino acid-binding ACT domain protein